MLKSCSTVLIAFLIACIPVAMHATNYEVGPGQTYTTIASVPNPQPGDTVNIHCGVYHEVRNWTSSGTSDQPIRLNGVCTSGKPIIDAANLDVSGSGSGPRGAWQISGAHYIISNLTFENARNGNNGAGLRIMNTGVNIQNVKITQCDMGLMTSTSNATNLLVENSEISFNGTGQQDGQSHNIYLTSGDGITFQYDYIHDAVSGTNVKSRAHYVQVLYNYIANGAQNEVDGDDEADTAIANSNMTLIGNVIVSRPDRTLNTSQFINFGQDVGGSHNGTLYLINNTLIAGSSSIGFLRSTASQSAIVAINNIFYGSNKIIQSGYDTGISGYNNWLPTTAVIPSAFSSNTLGTTPSFLDPATADYHLSSSSTARNVGYNSPVYYDGNGISQSGVPARQYVSSMDGTPRPSDGKLDAGAYEVGTVTTCTASAPGVSISPVTVQSVAAGTAVTYTVSVTNRDSSQCSNSSFDLASTVPSGWSATLNSTSLSLAPGASASATLQVTSPAGTASGSYNLGVTATNGTSSQSSSAAATYTVAVTPTVSAGKLTSPVAGTTLSGSSVMFAWTGSGVSQYYLYVGNSVGAADIYGSSTGTNTSATVGSIPTDGRTIYVRLWSLINNAWQYQDYTFKAATSGSGGGTSTTATLITPTPGSKLPSTTQTFSWTTGIGVSQYYLYIGTYPGGANLYALAMGTKTSITLSGLPTGSQSIYIRLWSYTSNGWKYSDYKVIGPN